MLEASINMTRRIGIEIECLAVDISGQTRTPTASGSPDIYAGTDCLR